MVFQEQKLRVLPDVEGGKAIYLFGLNKHEDGGCAKQTAIFIDEECNLTLYFKDRRTNECIFEDLEHENIDMAVERINKFLNEQ